MWKAGVTVIVVYRIVSIRAIDALTIIYKIKGVNFCG